MKPGIKSTPRSERTPRYYFDTLMENVFEMYSLCVPGTDETSFKRNIIGPLSVLPISGDAVRRNLNGITEEELGKADATMLACIYCIQSQQADRDGNEEHSWSLLIEAQHFIAKAMAADVSEPQLAKILDLARTEAKRDAAVKSAAARSKPWQETKQEAIRLIEEKALAGQRWQSVDEAALEIVENLRKFLQGRPGKKRKNFLSITPQKTIAGWLREMPNATELFNEQ